MLLVAGCAIGPSQRPPVATEGDGTTGSSPASSSAAPPTPPPALPPLLPTTPAIDFRDCTDDVVAALGGPAALGGRDLRMGCATVPVGGGYAPGTSTSASEVDVTRVTLGEAPPASVPIAVVGDAGRELGSAEAVRIAATGPADLVAGRALYGVDLRGSTGAVVDCVTPRTRAAVDDADAGAGDAAALAPLAAAAQTAARTCSQLLEDSLTEFTTATDADDLEQVRRVLQAPRLHAVGTGTGAAAVARWAQAHPDDQGRLVLDALPDPTVTAPTEADQGADAARQALDAFATRCVTTSCPLGPDPRGAVTDLVTRLRAAPLPARPDALGTVPGRAATAGTVVTALVEGLADPGSWPDLATALAAARAGDPAPVLARVDAYENDGGWDLALVHRCNDDAERQTVDQVAAAATRAAATDPVFGGWYAQRALLCSSWPVPTDPPVVLGGTSVPTLLLGTTGDPLVPLPATRRVAAGMEGSVMVSWLGAGHGAFPATPCIAGVVDDFLGRGVVPRTDTVCPP